jgi:hypothetical protein
VQPPGAGLGTDLLQGVLGDRGQERGEPHLVSLPCLLGPERELEEGARRRVLCRAVAVTGLCSSCRVPRSRSTSDPFVQRGQDLADVGNDDTRNVYPYDNLEFTTDIHRIGDLNYLLDI